MKLMGSSMAFQDTSKIFSKEFVFVSQEVCHTFNKFLLSIDIARHLIIQYICNPPLEKEYFPGYMPRKNTEYHSLA